MTASCTTPPIQRPTLDVCPPWCAGHEGVYQDWEDRFDGTKKRHHSADITVLDRFTVGPTQVEDADGSMTSPTVEVLGTDGLELSDGDAHELGLAIVRAADTARRYRLAQEAGR